MFHAFLFAQYSYEYLTLNKNYPVIQTHHSIYCFFSRQF